MDQWASKPYVELFANFFKKSSRNLKNWTESSLLQIIAVLTVPVIKTPEVSNSEE